MNESTENVFIHMGLPKSASTYLQSEVFPKLNCSIVPRNDPELDKIFSEYFHRPSNDFSLDISSILSGLSGTILFSNERSDIYTLDGRLRSLYIQMYKKLFPNSKIILVIRRQDNFVESLYKNNVMNGAWYSPLFYIGKKKNIMRNPKGVTFPVVDLSYLDWYDHIVELYSAFGKKMFW